MLTHLIYCSQATKTFSKQDLALLLRVARSNNARQDITGMLLYAEGSFFQVLEGEEVTINALLSLIKKDPRHENIVIIIQEPIAQRAFSDWTMGYAEITPSEIGSIIGFVDFFQQNTFTRLGENRARKLIEAFQTGYWRSKVNDFAGAPPAGHPRPRSSPSIPRFELPQSIPPPQTGSYSFAFQPIISAANQQIFSYEALLRGKRNESAAQVLQSPDAANLQKFDGESLKIALQLAAHLGLSTHLNLNIHPSSALPPQSAILLVQAMADQVHIRHEQIILEILEHEMIATPDQLACAVHNFRGSGMLFAIDDFGAGYAGLNLLADFQPHLIKLDMQLIRCIHQRGPRQAIIRGILRTCYELGIDVIAEGVETTEEYQWLRNEGIDLFQGYLFARPAFEQLVTSFHQPS